MVDINQVFQIRWKGDSQNLFLKKWNVDFDERNAQVDILPLWV
jgi:hypothetical protein